MNGIYNANFPTLLKEQAAEEARQQQATQMLRTVVAEERKDAFQKGGEKATIGIFKAIACLAAGIAVIFLGVALFGSNPEHQLSEGCQFAQFESYNGLVYHMPARCEEEVRAIGHGDGIKFDR